MKILVDKNRLLVIENTNIPKLKKYDFIASGARFSDYDKGIIIYHKKNIKIINWKNLGNNMNIFYIRKESDLIQRNLNKSGFLLAFELFEGFDENNGKKYFFIPKFSQSEMMNLNKKLINLGIDLNLIKSDKGIIWENKNGLNISKEDKNEYELIDELIDKGIDSIVGFLFGLVCIYGKMDIKDGEFISVKIHLPLFGQYMKYKEQIDIMIKRLQEDGIFCNNSIVKNNDGIIYQINSSDYELLGSFAKFYQSVEKIEKIFKQEYTKEVKSVLINFLDSEEKIPYDGKDDVMSLLEDGTIKILTVN